MNKYKIGITEILKKEIEVDATNGEKALDLVQKVYLKSNMLDFNAEDITEINAKVLEENGEIIANNQNFYDKEFYSKDIKNETDIDRKIVEIQLILSRLIFEDIKYILVQLIELQKYIDDKMDFVKYFAENAEKYMDDLDKSFENIEKILS